MNFLSKFTYSIACSILFVSCGSDDSQEPPVDTTPMEGVFIDSPVAGIQYHTATYSGKTDEAGRFQYQEGETVQFSIGDIELPATQAGTMIHVSDIFNGTTSDVEVINLARLLLTLDMDNNPENGITLSAAAFMEAEGLSIDFASDTFESDIADYVSKAGGTTLLIAEEVAKSHIEDTLEEVKNYTSEEEDAMLYGCGDDCVARANYHEYVTNFYPRHQQVNVAVDTKIELTIETEDMNVPGNFYVELFPLKENVEGCRIDWGGFTCGTNDSSDTNANWENIPNGLEFLSGSSDINPVVFGVSGAQVDSENKVTLSLAETLIPGVTYVVHIYNDHDDFVFKTWWVFTT